MGSSTIAAWAAGATVLFVSAASAVVLRLFAVRIRGTRLRLADYMIHVALLLEVGYIITVSVLDVELGVMGEHLAVVEAVSIEKIVPTMKGNFIAEFFWSTNGVLFRLSILLLYMDIFQTPIFRKLALGTSAIIVAYYVAAVLALLLLCTPIEYNWNVFIEGTCGNYVALEIFAAVFQMTLDIWVVFLPLPTIWQLQLPSNKKWALTVSFSLGLCTAAINLGRLIQTLQCPAEDQTYCARDRAILTLGEMSLGILVATVPLLGPLIRRRGHADTRDKTPSDERGQIVTFGSAPFRSQGKNSNVFSEETLLNSRAESDRGWPLEDMDATKDDTVTSENKIALATDIHTDTNWHAATMLNVDTRTTVEHDHYSETVPVPAGLIVRKREYAVDSW